MAEKQPRRCTVWWVDAHNSASHDFDSLEQIKGPEPIPQATQGWYVGEKDGSVTLAWTWIPDADHWGAYQFRGVWVIPLVNVQRIEWLKVGKTEQRNGA